MSAIYNIRTEELESYSDGDQIPVDIFFDKEFFAINVKFNGIKTRKIKGLGKMSTYHLQPALIDGYVFSEGDVMDIWVSVDGNQIPLMIESPITIGSVKSLVITLQYISSKIDWVHGTFIYFTCVIISDFKHTVCLLYTSPSPRDQRGSRMPSSA